MRIAVCDDDIKVVEFYRQILRKYKQGDAETAYFTDAAELEKACGETDFDLVFSDIVINDANGIKTAQKLCVSCPNVRIVFMTSYVLEFAEEIFMGVKPYGFIGKPVSEDRILYYIRRAEQEMERAVRKLTVSLSGIKREISASAIMYIESDKRRANIHCTDSVITVYERLDDMEKRLDDRFVRCHQSFLVNMEHIERLEGESFILRAPQTESVKISYSRLAETRMKYFEYVGRKIL